MFTMAGGSRWFCTTPEEDWPLAEMEGAKEAIKQDFYGKWGDRESSWLPGQIASLIRYHHSIGRQEREHARSRGRDRYLSEALTRSGDFVQSSSSVKNLTRI
jgi:hypothetical protein